MVDITVFRMEIDDSTFNAPFSGRAQSEGASPSTESSSDSGPSVKLIAGLGAVLVLTLLVLVVLLKRRFGGEDESNEVEVTTDSYELEKEEEEERGGIRAMIGLSFLVATTALMNHWNRSEQNKTRKL